MNEKIVLTWILSFYSDHIYVKGILSFFVIFIYAILIGLLKPYQIAFHNKLETALSIICFGSIILGLFVYNTNENFE